MLRVLALLSFLFASPLAPEHHRVAHVILDGAIDSNVADQFTQVLDSLKSPEAVIVEINSTGGEMEAAFRIAKAIERYPKKVVCVVDGSAMSATYYIVQSCDVRAVTKRSVLMVHGPATQVRGQEDEFYEEADALHALGLALVQHEAKKMTLTPEELLARIEHRAWYLNAPEELLARIEHRAWYLNAPEALQVKAVDAVVDDVRSVHESYERSLKLPGVE